MMGDSRENESLGSLPTARMAGRLTALMGIAGLIVGYLVVHTDIFFADGLRYIARARALHDHAWGREATGAVDHPAYPVSILAARAVMGGDRPEDWQRSAQVASAIAGVLLVAPLFLVVRDLFGDRVAVPATLAFYLVPLTGHVFADTLSESLFLGFWCWGLWGALRFLGGGGVGWVGLVGLGSGLAYLTRPEGLLLPAALGCVVLLDTRRLLGTLDRRKGLLLLAFACATLGVVGSFAWARGGLGTKPSIARLLGTAPRSAPHAVERQRPLDPDQTVSKTYVLAARAVAKAVVEATTAPLLALAPLGLLGWRRGRRDVLLAVIGVASVLALTRLHATGGYCSPRHAFILMVVLVPAGVAGWLRAFELALDRLERWVRPPATWVPSLRGGWIWGGVLGLAIAQAGDILAPVNAGMGGYREAGAWLAGMGARESGRVVDVTGWSQFYSGRDGYTFENLIAAPGDPDARWVVARESHLRGPWEYCQRLGSLVEGSRPVAVFEGRARGRPTRVLVFDRRNAVAENAEVAASARR